MTEHTIKGTNGVYCHVQGDKHAVAYIIIDKVGYCRDCLNVLLTKEDGLVLVDRADLDAAQAADPDDLSIAIEVEWDS